MGFMARAKAGKAGSAPKLGKKRPKIRKWKAVEPMAPLVYDNSEIAKPVKIGLGVESEIKSRRYVNSAVVEHSKFVHNEAVHAHRVKSINSRIKAKLRGIE